MSNFFLELYSEEIPHNLQISAREQLKKITESIDKARVENIEVLYSYLSAVILVALIVMSAILF